MALVNFPKYRSGLRDLERLGAEAAKTAANIRTNREENHSSTGYDDATHDRPLDGLEAAVVQHELLDLIYHFPLFNVCIQHFRSCDLTAPAGL